MKKYTVISFILIAPFAGFAQDVIHLPGGESIDRAFVNMLGTLVFLYILVRFILAIIRLIQDQRLKSKLIDKGVSDKIVEQFLQPGPKEVSNQLVRWFLIFLGLGIGLALVSVTAPLGIHSIAIMCFSIAFSYLGYYLFTRASEKKRENL